MAGTQDEPTPFYETWLDEIGDEIIWHHDVMWSGGDFERVRRWGFSAFSRAEQCEIMEALESNLRPVEHITMQSPPLYLIASRTEDYTGLRVSRLATRTVLGILGYTSHTRDGDLEDEARYNISLRAWDKFNDEATQRRAGRMVEKYNDEYNRELKRYMQSRTA